MINLFEVAETNKMIEQENLDVRTITIGISLLDCMDHDIDVLCKNIYNKMTKYFTIHIKNDLCDIWSEHYGTEMVIDIVNDSDIIFFKQVMEQYPESFSIIKLS